MDNAAVIQAFVGEYRRYKILGDQAIVRVNDVQFHAVIGDSSMAMYVHHVGGNLRSRFTDFLSSDGEKADRLRDQEFQLTDITKSDCLDAWNRGWAVLFDMLAALDDTHLANIVRIRNLELSVAAALTRSLAHIAYHVGQMVLLGKMHVGEAWESLSIPRNLSNQYNQNPNRDVSA